MLELGIMDVSIGPVGLIKEMGMSVRELSRLEQIGLTMVKVQIGQFADQTSQIYQRIVRNVGRDSLVLALNDSSGNGGEDTVANFEAIIAALSVFIPPKPVSVQPVKKT